MSIDLLAVASDPKGWLEKQCSTKPGPNDPPPFHQDDGKQPPPGPEPEQEPKEQDPSRE